MKITPNHTKGKEDEIWKASSVEGKEPFVNINLDVCKINSPHRHVVAKNPSIRCEVIFMEVGVDVKAKDRLEKIKRKVNQ